jgi:hypothetical protein
VPHTPEGAVGNGPGSDDDQGLTGVIDSFENDPIGVPQHAFGQHLKERIHRDVQERFGRYGLERLRDRTLARAADAIEEDNPSDLIHDLFEKGIIPKPCMRERKSRVVCDRNAWLGHVEGGFITQ